ncbi:prolipoprotein diacylglyceryl transferase [Candidatus Vampirococcus lugosii]|uniref:Phosphatidylglycerol--prolipoprotein diacylglyceryl transferase n=1 Tax=Candidatus Vampirococcus lugosii TaxID=2789015 RepID=A0ABS5QN74_9BACT|nr:prolipoprotein diacylglyceryl transferase [Candidatus Vampirococcus lugosii]MBS8122168.1 diacylglyceryl transferase [Candidatus Vampirococcus lugosii]
MVALEIFGISIYWYGIFYLLSFVLSYLFLYSLARSNLLDNYGKVKNLLKNNLDDIAFYIILGVLLGGRLGYVIFYNQSIIFNNIWEIFFIWQGGMAFVGGVIGVFLSMLYIKSKYKLSYKDFYFLIDLIVIVVPLGIFFGRIGNFLNQELFGKTIDEIGSSILYQNQELLEAINLIYIYETVDQEKRLNTNFLESFGEGLLLFLIFIVIFWKKLISGKYKVGLISGLFLLLYGIIRFIIEFGRDTTQVNYILGFTSSQYFMIIFIILGFMILFGFDKMEKKF